MGELIELRELQIKDIESQMGSIRDHVWLMIEKFNDSHFSLAVA